MQDLTTFDIVILAITLLLGLKGLFKGFIKEVFGLVGIVGGIFVASRLSDQTGAVIKPFLGLENEATISLIGFIAALIGFWLIVYVLGLILSKVTSMSGLGIVDRTLGFLFGAAKIFFIFAIIAYALYQVESFKSTLDKQFSKSVVFPYLVQTGSYIMKLDTAKFANSVDKQIDEVVPQTENKKPTTEVIQEKVEQATKDVKETIQEVAEQEVSQEVEAKVNEIKEKLKTAKEEEKTVIKEELKTQQEEVKGN